MQMPINVTKSEELVIKDVIKDDVIVVKDVIKDEKQPDEEDKLRS